VDRNTVASMEFGLYFPGMTTFHRAGLGGLASTLKCLVDDLRAEPIRLKRDQIPGIRPRQTIDSWLSSPPFEILEDRVILYTGEGEDKAEFLKRLYEYAFQANNGMFYMPGQLPYNDRYPSGSNPQKDAMDLIMVQSRAIITTFYQHQNMFKASESSKSLERVVLFDPSGNASDKIEIKSRSVSRYRHHQEAWKYLIDEEKIADKGVPVNQAIIPGAVNNLGGTESFNVHLPLHLAVPSHFAIVGCISHTLQGSTGFIVVPDVTDLAVFAKVRSEMMPNDPGRMHVSGWSDAALLGCTQCLPILHAQNADLPFDKMQVMIIKKTFSDNQKYRFETFEIRNITKDKLTLFQAAKAEFKPVYAEMKKPQSNGATHVPKINMALNVVSENIALSRPWWFNIEKVWNNTDGEIVQGGPVMILRKKDRQGLLNVLKRSTEMLEYGTSYEDRCLMLAIGCGIRRALTQVYKDYRGYGREAMHNKSNGVIDEMYRKIKRAPSPVALRFAIQETINSNLGYTPRPPREVKEGALKSLSRPDTKWKEICSLAIAAFGLYAYSVDDLVAHYVELTGESPYPRKSESTNGTEPNKDESEAEETAAA